MIDAELSSRRAGMVSSFVDLGYFRPQPLNFVQAVYTRQASGLVFYKADPNKTHSEHKGNFSVGLCKL